MKSVDGSTDNMNRLDRRRFATKKRAFRTKMTLPEFVKTLEQLDAAGLLEAAGIDPVTGEKRRRITAKGLEFLEAQAKHRSKH